MNEDSWLSPRQRKLAASALAVLSILVILAALFGAFSLLRSFVVTFSNVLLPLAIAGILAMLLRPVVMLFQNNLKLKRTPSIVLLFILVIGVLCAFAAWLLPVLLGQIQDLLLFAGSHLEEIIPAMRKKFPALIEFIKSHIGEEKFNQYLGQASALVRSLLMTVVEAIPRASTHIMHFIGLITAYAVIPIYLFYLLETDRDFSHDLHRQLDFIPERWRKDIVFLVREFVDIMVAFFRGQIIIGLLVALMLAVGFTLVGLRFGLILGMVIGLLNIVPYLGTVIGVCVVLPIAFFQPGGGWYLVGLCTFVFTAAQLISDYVLTPKIMGKKTGMSPMLIIFSIFFWGTALDGMMGMILAIPLSAFFLVFWRLARQHYLPALKP